MLIKLDRVKFFTSDFCIWGAAAAAFAVAAFPAVTALIQLGYGGAGVSESGSGLLGFAVGALLNSDSGAMMAMGRGFLTLAVFFAALVWMWGRRLNSKSDLLLCAILFSMGGMGIASAFNCANTYEVLLELSSCIAVAVYFLLVSGLVREFCLAGTAVSKESDCVFPSNIFPIRDSVQILSALVMLGSWGLYFVSPSETGEMTGSFYQKNMFGAFLLLGLPLILVRLRSMCGEAYLKFVLFRRSMPIGGWIARFVWQWLLFVSTSASLYLTYNRNAWLLSCIGFFASLYFCSFTSGNKHKICGLAAAVSGSVCAGAALVLYGSSPAWSAVLIASAAACALAIESGLSDCYSARTDISPEKQTAQKAVWTGRGVFLAVLITASLAAGGICCYCHSFFISHRPDSAAQAAKLGFGIDLSTARNRMGKIGTGNDKSLTSRLHFYKAAAEIVSDHPWLGVGSGNFERFYPQYQSDARWFSSHSHCMSLDMAAEGGLPVTVLFWVFVILCTGIVIKRSGSDADEVRVLRLGAACGSILLLLHAQFDVDCYVMTLPVWCAGFMGIAFGIPDTAELKAQGTDLSSIPVSAFGGIRWSEAPRMSMLCNIAPAIVCTVGFLLALHGFGGQCYMTLAKSWMNSGDNSKAFRCWRLAAQSDPSIGEYWRQCAVFTLNSCLNEEEAVKHAPVILELADKAEELDPHRASVYNIKGQALELCGRAGEAEKCYRRALELDCKNSSYVYANLARLYMRSGRNAEALSVVAEAFKTFPLDILRDDSLFGFRRSDIKSGLTDCLIMGFSLSRNTDSKLARRYLAAALELKPELIEELLSNLSGVVQQKKALEKLGRTKEAGECASFVNSLSDDIAAACPGNEKLLKVLSDIHSSL